MRSLRNILKSLLQWFDFLEYKGTQFRKPNHNPRGGKKLLLQVIILVLIAWEFLPLLRVVNPVFFPRLSSVLKEVVSVLASKTLTEHIVPTFVRLVLAFFVGAITGILAAVGTVYWPKIAPLFNSFMLTLSSTPKVALLPIFILWFGVGEFTKVIFAALTTFYLVASDTYTGLKETAEELPDAAMLDGASGFTLMFRVAIPASLPVISNGLRSGASYGLVSVLTSEMIASNNGIGLLMMDAQYSYRAATAFALLILAIWISALFRIAFSVIEEVNKR